MKCNFTKQREKKNPVIYTWLSIFLIKKKHDKIVEEKMFKRSKRVHERDLKYANNL
jgi:hypothetical protein